MCDKGFATVVPARMLAKKYMTLLVVVHTFDFIFREIAVSALVYFVLPTVAIARFHSMVSPVLVPRIYSVAEHFTAV